ncbi:MAG: radical SAM protein [Thermoproteota archaeon]|nr:radical SAM protein [Thermoproteota archaeon]
MNQPRVIKRIRVSIGSAIVLRLLNGRLDAKPTTAYLLTYKEEKCTANCAFCPQARTSSARSDKLSRVTWLPFPLKQVFSGIKRTVQRGEIKRVCIQALNYPTVFKDLLALVKQLRLYTEVPISLSCQPLNCKKLKELLQAGVERISIALDAATKKLFDQLKGKWVGGPYVWERQRRTLLDAVKIFGEGLVTTHLIVGLGETEREMVQTIQWSVDSKVYPSLFAFTPIRGTALENRPPPSVDHYRRIQIAQHLITRGEARFENMKFNPNGKIVDFGVPKNLLLNTVKSGRPFLTSGCPNCNRPYYNERPGGPIYNYPRPLTREEILEIEKQVKGFRV